MVRARFFFLRGGMSKTGTSRSAASASWSAALCNGDLDLNHSQLSLCSYGLRRVLTSQHPWIMRAWDTRSGSPSACAMSLDLNHAM